MAKNTLFGGIEATVLNAASREAYRSIGCYLEEGEYDLDTWNDMNKISNDDVPTLFRLFRDHSGSHISVTSDGMIMLKVKISK